MADIILIRHAESEINVIGEAYQRGNDLFTPEVLTTPDAAFPLTRVGIHHAHDLGNWLRETYGLKRFVATTSEYRRAEQTYTELGFKQSACIESALDEHDWGDFMRSHPLNSSKQRFSFDRHYATDCTVQAPHGESTADVYRRVSQYWRQNREHFTTTQLIVSHERTLIVLQMVIEGIQLTDQNWAKAYKVRAGLPNVGIVIYTLEFGALRRVQLEWPYANLSMYENAVKSGNYESALLYNKSVKAL